MVGHLNLSGKPNITTLLTLYYLSSSVHGTFCFFQIYLIDKADRRAWTGWKRTIKTGQLQNVAQKFFSNYGTYASCDRIALQFSLQ